MLEPRRRQHHRLRHRRRRTFAAIALLTLLAGGLAASPAAADGLEIADPYPLRGEPVAVTVTAEDPSADLGTYQVAVTYRPNSQTPRHEVLLPGPDGRLDWTPLDAGIVNLELIEGGDPEGQGGTSLATETVSVRYGAFPPQGLVIMILAFLLLFGGATWGMALLLRADHPHLIEEVEPPST